MGFQRGSCDPAGTPRRRRFHPLGGVDQCLQAVALARKVSAQQHAEPGSRQEGAGKVWLVARWKEIKHPPPRQRGRGTARQRGGGGAASETCSSAGVLPQCRAPSTTLRSLRELRAVPLPRSAALRGGGKGRNHEACS